MTTKEAPWNCFWHLVCVPSTSYKLLLHFSDKNSFVFGIDYSEIKLLKKKKVPMHKYSEHTRLIWFDKISVALSFFLLNRTHIHTHTRMQIKLGQLFCSEFPEMVMCLLQLFSSDVFMATSVHHPGRTTFPLQSRSIQPRALCFLGCDKHWFLPCALKGYYINWAIFV